MYLTCSRRYCNQNGIPCPHCTTLNTVAGTTHITAADFAWHLHKAVARGERDKQIVQAAAFDAGPGPLPGNHRVTLRVALGAHGEPSQVLGKQVDQSAKTVELGPIPTSTSSGGGGGGANTWTIRALKEKLGSLLHTAATGASKTGRMMQMSEMLDAITAEWDVEDEERLQSESAAESRARVRSGRQTTNYGFAGMKKGWGSSASRGGRAR